MSTINEMWDDLTSSEQLVFKKSCRRLLKETFIVRDKDDDNRKLFFFIKANEALFSDYLNLMGFELVVKDNGIVMLQNNDSNVVISKQKFSKFQSIILCCLWTLYMDKVQSGSLSKQITVSFPELNAELEKFEFKGAFDIKRDIKTALQLFARYNLIFVNWNAPDNERVIVLYPSIQFALDESEFAAFVTVVRERMSNADSQNEDVVDERFDAEGEEE
ncbi:DUF4194 domain-containing protein [Fibrobacter sp. UWB10]|uniref:DUF4194 domain-containing protein n=1 Tax=Fibrobacter sp. UWB10 TaxID=1896201 RepID=UPI00240324C9|nr:DUF4194 domain-containing protein [Fibrobacter sp. UWB10]SMP42339.1 protein of unknown function [Fibrobacter sp. UWB10]